MSRRGGCCSSLFIGIIVVIAAGALFGRRTENNTGNVSTTSETNYSIDTERSVTVNPTEKPTATVTDNSGKDEDSEPRGVTGIEVTKSHPSIEDFRYEITGNAVKLKSYKGRQAVIELKTSYNIDGTDYYTDISDFQVGIGNSSAKTVIIDEGFTEVPNNIFNSCDVQKVFFPRSMICVYDNTLSYLHPAEGQRIKIYYAGTQEEWSSIFTAYQRTYVEDAEFGEELGTALADKLNEMIGAGYDSSQFEYYFSASPSDLL